MLYSKRFLCTRRALGALAVSALLMCAQPGSAEPDLIGGNLGVSSSKAGNNLFDADERQPVSAPKISPAEAADLVRRQVGGQVMSVNTQHKDSGVVYGVKVLNAGRMRVIHVDGHSGQLLNH